MLRLVIGLIFINSAFPKLKHPAQMSQGVGMPKGMILVMGIIELLGGLGIILGIYTQLSALLLGIVMIGAIYFKIVKWHVPFASMQKTGWEFDLILLAGSLAVLLGGGGTIGVL